MFFLLSFPFLLDPKTDPVGPLPNKGGHGTNDKVGDNLQHRTVPKHDTESHGALQQISAHCIKISDAYGVNNDKADEMRCQLLFERNRAAAPDVRSPNISLKHESHKIAESRLQDVAGAAP